MTVLNSIYITAIVGVAWLGASLPAQIPSPGLPATNSPYVVSIDSDGPIALGGRATTAVRLLDADLNSGVGGFDLQIGYDATMLGLVDVVEGELYTTCEWEYFVTQSVPTGPCDSYWCPSGFIRLVGIAELAPSPDPVCGESNVDSIPLTIATLEWAVSPSADLPCILPLSFVWTFCADNALSNSTGTQLIVSDEVWTYGPSCDTMAWGNVGTLASKLPGFGGFPSDCLPTGQINRPAASIAWINGFLWRSCATSRGGSADGGSPVAAAIPGWDDPCRPGGGPVTGSEIAGHSASGVNSLVRDSLRANYPNPFNPTTNIRFWLAQSGGFELTIYNSLGQIVEQIPGSGAAGEHEIEWHAGRFPSGVYLYRLRTESGASSTRKMLLIK